MMKLLEAQQKIYEGEKCWASMQIQAPCEAACPIGMKVPDYAMAVAQGKFEEAYWVMRESTPFVPICAYVCHHPCEAACTRGKVDEPIDIRGLKRFVADSMLKEGWDSPEPFEKFRKEKVAVVGSGPAGLSAAYYLAREGYGVTVFDAHTRLGGMLVFGIPEFVLPRKVVEAQVRFIETLGVDFKPGVCLGKDITLDDLLQQGYEAVFLGVGAPESLTMKIPGIETSGVLPAMDMIREVNQGKRIELGQKVALIGGGNVAVEAARMALRLGVREVHIICPEKREQMTAFGWEIQKAEQEGIRIYCGLATLEVLSDKNRVSGVRLGQVDSFERDAEGNIKFTVREGDGPVIREVDNVVVAIGQRPDAASLAGLNLSARGSVTVDPETLETSIKGVFAGGDVHTPAGTVTDALAAGKKAAESIGQYLRGMPMGRPADIPAMEVPEEQAPRFLELRNRVKMPVLPAGDRIKSFDLVEQGLSREEAIYEAKRCLNCSMCGNCMFLRLQCCYKTGSRLL